MHLFQRKVSKWETYAQIEIQNRVGKRSTDKLVYLFIENIFGFSQILNLKHFDK